MGKIQNFRDLLAWQEGHKLVLFIYEITNKFPQEEKFGLTNQIRRAVVSITSNIAEGFGRSSAKDKHHFFVMAKTSLSEVENQLLIAKDLGYVTLEKYTEVGEKIELTHRLLGGLIKLLSQVSHV
ncbi:MAG: four helix bundle protein [Patescibacteria group bacterium]